MFWDLALCNATVAPSLSLSLFISLERAVQNELALIPPEEEGLLEMDYLMGFGLLHFTLLSTINSIHALLYLWNSGSLFRNISGRLWVCSRQKVARGFNTGALWDKALFHETPFWQLLTKFAHHLSKMIQEVTEPIRAIWRNAHVQNLVRMDTQSSVKNVSVFWGTAVQTLQEDILETQPVQFTSKAVRYWHSGHPLAFVLHLLLGLGTRRSWK